MSIHRIVPAAVAAAFALITAIPAEAKPAAKPKVKAPTAKAATAKPTTAKAKPVKAQGAQAKSVKPAKVTAKGSPKATGKNKTTASVDVAKGSSQKAKGDKSARTAVNDPTTSRREADPTVTRSAPLSKAQQQLLKNDNLRAKMAARLPGNIDPVIAAGGFKNLGQFVATVNVSNNQGVDFKAMRQLMIGTEQMSIGQALQHLKRMDAQTASAAVDTATATASRDLADASTTKPKTKRNGRG